MTRTPFRRTMSHRDLVGLFRSSHWSCCVEKCGLKNFANFLGKHLCWSLFVIALPVELHLRKTASICFTSKYYNKWKWRIWTRLDLYRVQSIFLNVQRCRSEVFCKKAVHRNFTKFTGKYLCQSLFFNKVASLRRRCYRTPLVAASERNSSIQPNAAKITKFL